MKRPKEFKGVDEPAVGSTHPFLALSNRGYSQRSTTEPASLAGRKHVTVARGSNYHGHGLRRRMAIDTNIIIKYWLYNAPHRKLCQQ